MKVDYIQPYSVPSVLNEASVPAGRAFYVVDYAVNPAYIGCCIRVTVLVDDVVCGESKLLRRPSYKLLSDGSCEMCEC